MLPGSSLTREPSPLARLSKGVGLRMRTGSSPPEVGQAVLICRPEEHVLLRRRLAAALRPRRGEGPVWVELGVGALRGPPRIGWGDGALAEFPGSLPGTSQPPFTCFCVGEKLFPRARAKPAYALATEAALFRNRLLPDKRERETEEKATFPVGV